MLKELLGRPIAFHRCLAEMVGSINGAVMLGQAIYWTTRGSLPDGWFYKSQSEWHDETMLTRTEQDTVRKKLRTFAFWGEDLRGVPATMHYRVDLDNLMDCLAVHPAGNPQTSMQETCKLDNRNPASKIAETPQTFTSSENTSEITTENPVLALTNSKGQTPEEEQRLLQQAEELRVAREERRAKKANKGRPLRTVPIQSQRPTFQRREVADVPKLSAAEQRRIDNDALLERRRERRLRQSA